MLRQIFIEHDDMVNFYNDNAKYITNQINIFK